jgi:asparagine synthase (glutamine-hydrolysing)
MCGIAGKVSLRGPVPDALVQAMCARQVHRGPDSSGTYLHDGIGLGVQRLRIIDLETGDQPIYNEDRSVVVMLNGEIYNYRELRSELRRRGHSFSTNGDTEVIAHLYEEKGPDLVGDLHGMFAFAIWDERRRRLLLARDRVGKKPLFYCEGEGWLSFASELRALIADPDVPREIDPSSIGCYLAYGYVPSPWSIWRRVRKLPPAHTLVWEEGHTAIQRYWRLDYSRKRTADRRELEPELRRVIGAAVRRRMVADVPVGVLLSGGVDSSIVTAEMAAAAPEPIKTFSIGFEEAAYDELPRARLVAQRFGTDHHEFVVRPDAVKVIPRIVRHYGEPYADSSAIPSFYVADLTRRHVTVALDGDGGDESFAGYWRHVANSLTASIGSAPYRLRRGLANVGDRLPRQSSARGTLTYARRLLTSLDQDDPARRYARHVSVFSEPERAALLDPDFRGTVSPSQPQQVLSAPWSEADGLAPLDRVLAVDVETYLPGDLLTKMDIATMAHSLEARSPLLDTEVMELAASLPVELKSRFGTRQRILRRAYRGIVPDKTLDGRKMGFAVPLGEWFRTELRDYSREVLLDRRCLGRGYFSESFIHSMLDEHAARRRDRSAQIWATLMLELWHQEFVDEGAGSS